MIAACFLGFVGVPSASASPTHTDYVTVNASSANNTGVDTRDFGLQATDYQQSKARIKDEEAHRMLALANAIEAGDSSAIDGLLKNAGISLLEGPPKGTRNVGAAHFPQETKYYCGPASVKSVLNAKSIHVSQYEAASGLGTTEANGTGTASIASYLTSRVSHLGGSYSVEWLPEATTSAMLETYRGRLLKNVSEGYAMVGNLYIVNDKLSLPGYPHASTEEPLYHFVAIGGYENYAHVTQIVDPSSGSAALPTWRSAAHASVNSQHLLTLMGGRGYIW